MSPLALNGLAVLACSACYGDPTGQLTVGAKAGVLFLVGVILAVLGGIVFMIGFWARRARMLAASDAFDQKPPMKLTL